MPEQKEPVFRERYDTTKEIDDLILLIAERMGWSKRRVHEEAIKLLAATLEKGEGEQ